MTKTEELIVALMEFDPEPLQRFVRALSDEDLAKFGLALNLAATVTYAEENRREHDPATTTLDWWARHALKEQMRKVQADVLWGSE